MAKSEKERHTEVVAVRFTRQQRREVERRAKAAKLEPSVWLRQWALSPLAIGGELAK